MRPSPQTCLKFSPESKIHFGGDKVKELSPASFVLIPLKKSPYKIKGLDGSVLFFWVDKRIIADKLNSDFWWWVKFIFLLLWRKYCIFDVRRNNPTYER